MTRWLAITSVLLASCGGGAADSGSFEDPGGGNVGFGGAQDIGQFRGILDSGGIPGPETLDANGFFAEHYAELPSPDCGQPLCLHALQMMGTDWIDTQMSQTLLIAMNTPQSPADIERMPLNLVVVLDTSGSMAEDDRIGFARQGLHRLVDALEPGDRLALVTYDSTVTVHSDLSADADTEALHALIDGMSAGGATNIYDGLGAGFSLLSESYDVERQNRVIMVSDGLATAGITDDSQIIAMAEQSISDGIGLTTIGVGLDFDVGLMRGLAERGAGNFYFLESASAIEEVFTEEIDYFVSPLALDITIDVVADGAYDLGDVTGTRLWETSGSSGSVYVPAAFLASRDSEDPGPNGRRGGGSALFIDMTPRSAQDPYRLAVVRLTYRDPITGELHEQSAVMNSPYASDETPPEDTYLSHQLLKHHWAMYQLYLGLHRASTEAETNYGCALATLDSLETRTRAWNSRHEDVDIAADLSLIAQFRTNLREAGGDPIHCEGFSDPDTTVPPDEPGWGTGEGDDVVLFGCSASGGASSTGPFALLGIALLLATRKRKAASSRARR